MTRAAFLLLAMGSPLLSGCGTFADAMAGPADDHLYYRGVRMDLAAIKNGAPVMALDLPFSACADTLVAPSIAFRQLTDPAEAKHKSVLHVAQEGLVKSMTNDVIVPISAEMMKAGTDSSRSSPSTTHPVAYPKAPE